MDWGQEAQRRLDKIATCSSPGPGVTRLPYTPEHAAAIEQISDWMCRAGLEPRLDAAATLVGRSASPSNGAAVLIGSHQDSVVEGGALRWHHGGADRLPRAGTAGGGGHGAAFPC